MSPLLDRVDPQKASDTLREEAAQLINRLCNPSEVDIDRSRRLVDCIVAVAMLDRNAEGPDHKTSIEPHTFKIMVESIRDIEKCLGDGVKRVMPSEEKLREAWRG